MSHDPADPSRAAAMARDEAVRRAKSELFLASARHRYSYNFKWLGRPIIQYPEDVLALQELVWSIKPDVVIETGVAHGGSLIFYASLLQLLGGDGYVVGIDIDIRPHNRQAIEEHPMSSRIRLVEGSSTDASTLARVEELTRDRKRALVVLDSMHTHDHVLRELELYEKFVTAGSYLVVLDTVVEHMPKEFFPDRPWGPGDNPLTAVNAFLAKNDRFVVDEDVENKLLLSVAPRGFLKCVKD